MFFLQSKQLKLIPLDHAQLLLLAQNREGLVDSLGLNKSNLEVKWDARVESDFMKELQDALDNISIPAVAKRPAEYLWFTHWLIVHQADNVIIGGIGVFGLPAENKGETMTGYFMDKKYEGQGYTTEALACLLDWAFTEPTLDSVIADTPEWHLASQKVLQKNGFVFAGKVEEGFRWRRFR